MFKESNARMKKIMSGQFNVDHMNIAQREAEIMVKNCNVVMGFFQVASKNARTLKGLERMNIMDDTTAVDLMLGDPEIDKIKCPEKDDLILRCDCLDYSGQGHEECIGCEIGKVTKNMLLPIR